MIQTALVTEILERANAIKTEYNHASLQASHIAAAIGDLCKTPYLGLDLSAFSYPRFEEERMRYLFSKVVKLPSFFRLRLSANRKTGVTESAFDLSCCEPFINLHGREILSADILFLCALKQLHPTYLQNTQSPDSDDAIMALLQDTNTHIYDYVIEKIDGICAELKKKSDEAAALRDWKPAAKFTEPETLTGLFFEKIEKQVSGNVMTLKFPRFFGTTCLKVSIHRSGDLYYVHDNGCAIRHLAKQVPDKQRRERIIKKVCHACWIDKNRIADSFLSVSSFLLYLQKLVFVAHADLYYSRANCQLVEKDKNYMYVPAQEAEPLDENALIRLLKQGIHFDYDENKGLYYWLDMRYALFSTRCAFLLETLEKGCIRISDKRKDSTEGEIFESFYWDNNNLTQHKRFIDKLASRFGAEFDGKDIYLTDKNDNFHKAMFRFFNLAVLLSEFGHNIEVRL